MGKVGHIVIFFGLVMTIPLIAQGQDKVKYTAEGSMDVFKLKGEKVQRLIEKVVFTQKTTTIYCDSAFFYRKRNSMEAFGRVRIVDDSVTITARNLYYNGNTRKAELRNKVVYTKGVMRLTTDNLDYDMESEISHYFDGGKLKDTTNTLTSQTGNFYAKQNYATFKTNVVLTAPDYILKSNDLHYNTKTKVATTPGATEITTPNGESKLDADGGEFRTVNDQSIFVDGKVETPNNFLEGDDLFFDNLKKYYKAEGNVKLIAKNKDIIIVGDEGYNDEANTISKIYGNSVMKRIMENDTLYIAADTLVYIESDIDTLKRILAYSNVKMYKLNLQGLADSVAYLLSDSMIYMYEDPILWNRASQIEGDTIRIEISDNAIKRMFLRRKSFLASQDTLLNFNQIKGRHMTANFVDGDIDNVDVNGNGEVIYYALAEGDSILMGMNRILCSNLKLQFKNRSLKNIRAYVKPEARFIPPHELTDDVQTLIGFLWQGDERPTLEEVLNRAENVQKPIIDEIPDKGKQPIFLDEMRPEGLQKPKKVKKLNMRKQ
ncbi:MAG: LPS export ABC transporter periplasmic protein LptC [Cytophagales bacterium]|nr:LPS export ABC transporter periplasmic protein LptC [Cytophagales bacterium]